MPKSVRTYESLFLYKIFSISDFSYILRKRSFSIHYILRYLFLQKINLHDQPNNPIMSHVISPSLRFYCEKIQIQNRCSKIPFILYVPIFIFTYSIKLQLVIQSFFTHLLIIIILFTFIILLL